jgi:hypothetical protein
LPFGAPPRAPWKRQTVHPFTAGACVFPEPPADFSCIRRRGQANISRCETSCQPILSRCDGVQERR